jgi:type I restriction enzyme S subunit
MSIEWDRQSVEQLVADGKLLIGDGYRATNSELGASGLPFARAGNVNGGFNFEQADRFPPEHLRRVGNKVSEPGDVVFTSKGTVGRFAFVRETVERFVYSPQLCFWRSLAPDEIDPRFLYYWMTGPEFYVQFKSVAGQTDMAEYVSLRDQRRMHVTLPPIAEQRAIGRVLGALDDKIELNRCMNETLEALAQAFFKSWFVDFDPVRAKAQGGVPGLPQPIADLFPDRFDDSELAEVPAGWGVVGLDEIARFVNGLALQKFPPTDGRSLPAIKIAQLRAGNTEGADRASADVGVDFIVEDGDVLFSWSGSLECVLWAGGPGALNQHLFRVTSSEYPKWFYYFWIREHLDDFRAIAAGKATTMGHIQRYHLSEARVVAPPPATLIPLDSIIGPLLERTLAQNCSITNPRGDS